MRRVFNLRTLACTAIAFALICGAGMMPLRAQNGEGKLAGAFWIRSANPYRAPP